MKTVYDKNGNPMNMLLDSDIECINSDNGSCIKFYNGLMIYHARKDVECSFYNDDVEYLSHVANPFVFPVEFIGIPTVSVVTANTKDYLYCSVIGVIRDNKKIETISFRRGKPAATGYKVGVQLIAIGRWK